LPSAMWPIGRVRWRRLEAGAATEASSRRIQEQEAAVGEPGPVPQQLREIDSSFGALLKQLPNQVADGRAAGGYQPGGSGPGLQFELFKPAPQETMKDFYAELPVSVRVTGSYHDMGQFASDIAQLSRIVTLTISPSPGGKDGSVLAMDTSAKTFRYLDEEEVAKQKKAGPRNRAPAKK